MSEAKGMGVFATHARKYWERGLSIMPVRGKRAFLPGWQKFCVARASDEELSAWEHELAETNLGLCLGPASGLVALDIDTDEKLDLPMSHVVRRGLKGEVRLFKYRDGLDTRIFKHLKVELRSKGAHVVLPPSIHPDTGKEYFWTASDDFENAPDWPHDGIRLLEKLEAQAEGKARLSGSTGEPGRNNRLKEIAVAMLTRGESSEEIVCELLKEDSKHATPLFTDPSDGYGKDAVQGAYKFVGNLTVSLARAGKMPAPAPSVPLKIEIPASAGASASSLANKPSPSWRPEIPASGLLRLAYDYQLDIANDECPALFAGGAIAFVSALLGNKFSFMGAWPNVYVFNIAKSGYGKGWPYRLINDFLAHTGIVGPDVVKSASALVKDFGSAPWRTRLDPLDEVGGMLGLIKRGGAFQSELVDTFCRLWSASSGFYAGIKYSNKDKDIDACWNPYHVVLASTTPHNLSENHEKIWSDKGFGPRFLYFIEEGEIAFKERGTGEKEKHAIEEAVRRLLAMEPSLVGPGGEPLGARAISTGSSGTRYAPIALTPTPEALKLIRQIERSTRIEKVKASQELLGGAGASFVARHAEQMLKLACIHAVSEGLEDTREVSLRAVEWAQGIVEGQWAHTFSLLEEIHTSGSHGKVVRDVSKFIQERGSVKKSEILKFVYNRSWSKDMLDKALDALCEQQEITEFKEPRKGPGRPALVYFWGHIDTSEMPGAGAGPVIGES